jgi:hypothetical protein
MAKPNKTNVATKTKAEPRRVKNRVPKKTIIPRIYYAHCMNIYDTPQEERDVLILQDMGFEVVNPNNEDTQAEVKRLKDEGRECMEYFERVIATCDHLAFRALPGGFIPAGVAHEIAHALETDMIVIELPTFSLRRVMTVDETRQYLMEQGER